MSRKTIFILAIVALRVVAVIMNAYEKNGSKIGPPRSEKAADLTKAPAVSAEDIGKKLAQKINGQRPTGSLPVRVDMALSKWLSGSMGMISLDDLATLETQLAEQMPRYVASARWISSGNTEVQALDKLPTLAGKLESFHNCVGFYSVRTNEGRFRAMMVACHRAADFTPEALSDHRTMALLGSCPLCRATHMWRSTHVSSVLTMGCPHCKMDYAILAPDNQGSYRYVNEFLTGYEPPAHFPKGISKLQEMMIIWQAVWDGCAYTRDNRSSRVSRESWQPGVETLTRQQGDCEDTSILAADWLISRGFNARVAIGTAGPNFSGHAWVVVPIDGEAYLLESTTEPPPPSVVPTVARLGENYHPQALFDRDAIYFPRNGKAKFDGDYWSSNWRRVAPRVRQLPKAPEPVVAVTATKEGAHPVAMPKAKADDEVETQRNRLAPLKRLAKISEGSKAWQIHVPLAVPAVGK